MDNMVLSHAPRKRRRRKARQPDIPVMLQPAGPDPEIEAEFREKFQSRMEEMGLTETQQVQLIKELSDFSNLVIDIHLKERYGGNQGNPYENE
jgi:hypothetical protein